MFKNRPNIKLCLFVVLASLFFWIIDSLIDIYLGGQDETFLESLFDLDPSELWMRSLVVVLMVSFGVYARKQLRIQTNISQELTLYKNDLESIVEERTKKLEDINRALQNEILERKEIERKLEYLATIDELTQLYNRRKFDEIFDTEIAMEKRYQLGLSLINCDIDQFKQINDRYGHDIGDEILIAFAEVLKHSLRATDTVARWGGEEFVMLVPNQTIESAGKIAEKARRAIEATVFEHVGRVTASFGVTHYINDDTKKSMFKRADEALYKAKENGRNRVEVIV